MKIKSRFYVTGLGWVRHTFRGNETDADMANATAGGLAIALRLYDEHIDEQKHSAP